MKIKVVTTMMTLMINKRINRVRIITTMMKLMLTIKGALLLYLLSLLPSLLLLLICFDHIHLYGRSISKLILKD